ncbi:pseudouridine synthase [Alicyclobacillus tolerans]|uniref:pseudouridine synthase n=1 Tax=Alicyclobacillus tolerans TaxID=90970 RepID=UPI003B7BC57E
MEERLQKVLASAGIASRRKCEEYILSGRVAIDGKIVKELGTKVDPMIQEITVDGHPIAAEPKISILLHKPTSRISSVTDPEGRKTVMEKISSLPFRLYPVGRLDYDSSGLLLLTNDGELTHKLLHPSHHIGKLYRVTALGMVDKKIVRNLEQGIELEDGVTAPAKVWALRQHPKESVVDIEIFEGKNRQIRRMFEKLDLPVKRLKRIAFGPLKLNDLRVGQWRFLDEKEWGDIYRICNLPIPDYPKEIIQTYKLASERRIRNLQNQSDKKKGNGQAQRNKT